MKMSDEKLPIAAKTVLATGMILLAAAVRVAPHPWNFTPIGAMALFSGALLRNRWTRFAVPLVALFAGDIFVGFHKLMPAVYASFLVSVTIGIWISERRTITRIGTATLLGALQFFLVTNFAVWLVLGTYPRTLAGLGACYLAAIPFFWNTLAGDALYVVLLFGGFALAEHVFPVLREPASESSS